MTIKEKGYTHWDGEFLDKKLAWLPITRYGIKLTFRKKFFKLLFFLALTPAVLFLAGIYVLAIPWLDQTLGLAGRGFSVAYILLAAWFWGIWGGIAANLLNLPLNLFVSKLSGQDLLPLWPVGNVVLFSIGIVAGLLRDLSLKLQEQLHEKERTEKKLEAYREQLEEMVEQRTAELSDANEQLKESFFTRSIKSDQNSWTVVIFHGIVEK